MDPFLADLCLAGIYLLVLALLVTAIYQAVVSFVEVVHMCQDAREKEAAQPHDER